MPDRKLMSGAERVLFINEEDWTRSVLKAGRCAQCGNLDFPRGLYCKGCLSSDLSAVELSRWGVLYSFSHARVCARGFAPPYVFGYVDLPEGIRVYSQLEPADPACFHSGMEMELTMGEIRREGAGTGIWGYKFKPRGRG